MRRRGYRVRELTAWVFFWLACCLGLFGVWSGDLEFGQQLWSTAGIAGFVAVVFAISVSE